MEPLIEPINEPVIVEETTVPAHPLEAPQVGQTEAEQSSEEAAAQPKQKTPVKKKQNKAIS